MKTKASIDSSLHWTEHYIEYGFAVLESLVDREFCESAVEAVKQIVGSDLPLDEWTVDNIKNPTGRVVLPDNPDSPRAVLGRIYDQPHLRTAIDEMFGTPERFNNDRHFSLFVKPRDPRAKPLLSPVGHIDFAGNKRAPVLGSGFMFQCSLIDKEPFGGNLTIYPGIHKYVMRHIMDDPNWVYPRNWGDIPRVEPFEFVAEAGDVIFFHHLVGHDGNLCTTRMPRISLHCQALCDEWLTEIDPAKSNLSPWERSLAMNGPYRIDEREAKMREDYMSAHRAA